MKVFVTSDHHFGHEGTCRFLNKDGKKVRPWDNAHDMDRDMIERWNSTVNPDDKVYHLGDVAWHRRHLEIMLQLHGRKVLIRGNHDRLKLSQYSACFKDVRGVHVMDNVVLSHIPVHPISKLRFKGNIHGHMHEHRILDAYGKIDPWYRNVCVECTDYRPILFDSIKW